MENKEALEKLGKEWLSQYKKKLRKDLVSLCHKNILNAELVVIGHALNCDIRPVVVECLKELAKDLEENHVTLS